MAILLKIGHDNQYKLSIDAYEVFHNVMHTLCLYICGMVGILWDDKILCNTIIANDTVLLFLSQVHRSS